MPPYIPFRRWFIAVPCIVALGGLAGCGSEEAQTQAPPPASDIPVTGPGGKTDLKKIAEQAKGGSNAAMDSTINPPSQ